MAAREKTRFRISDYMEGQKIRTLVLIEPQKDLVAM